MSDVEIVIVGSGVVGLTIARALTRMSRDVIVIERHDKVATQTSSRNSEVIHAGLYYPPGSLKARASIAGNEKLYRYCADRDIPVQNCGKLIVVQDENEIAALQRLIKNAQACGITDLKLLSEREACELEPALTCAAACLSPSTGTLDSHAYAAALEADVLSQGGMIVHHTHVVALNESTNSLGVETCDDATGQHTTINARIVINAGGLGAQDLSRTLSTLAEDKIPPLHFGKGHYFDYTGKVPFARLIYPMPSARALGIHLTRDAGGRARFGPDFSWVDRPDYRFEDDDGQRKKKFTDAIQRYWPEVDETHLHPGTTGIRPKLAGPGEGVADFAIHGPKTHRVRNYFALYGIESPGLTASLALGDMVAERVQTEAED